MSEISAKALGSLLKAGDICKTKTQSISGDFGQRVKDHVEKDELHAGAFKSVMKLYRMDPEKRDDFRRSFQFLCDLCDEHGLFENHAGDLADLSLYGQPFAGHTE